jgi:predicted membrane channel-forming protein YqfA (hemolysin III family)
MADDTNSYLPIAKASKWLFLMGGLYLSGLYVYARRIPERYFPRKFDIWVSKPAPFSTKLTAILNLLP